MRTAILILSLFFYIHGTAQPYLEKQTRHRFAQLTLGLEHAYYSNSGTSSYSVTDGGITNYKPSPGNETKFVIGGTHFWGHADFYVSIPVIEYDDPFFTAGIETGARWYPWRIQDKRLRPYAGISLNTTSVKQADGAKQYTLKTPLSAGLTYNFRNHLFGLGSTFDYKNETGYYISPTVQKTITTPEFWFQFSWKYRIETTLSAEKSWMSGTTETKTKELADKGKLNGFTIAAGPSSAFFTGSSNYNSENYPSQEDHTVEGGFFDWGLGYYHHKTDLQLNLAYRNIKSELKAYAYRQNAERNAFTMECYKFLFDYHGFVPFAGPAISYEMLDVKQYVDNNKVASGNSEVVKPGITFGWDIRPNRIQSWLLRTNLRYFPNLNVTMPDGLKVELDQIEFNFIQLVIFPQRFRL